MKEKIEVEIKMPSDMERLLKEGWEGEISHKNGKTWFKGTREKVAYA